MATWTDVSSTVLEPGDPIRSVDIIAIKENIIALSEGAVGAPKILTPAINDAAITSVKLATGTNERDWVLARTASASVGAVGTYAFLVAGTSTTYAAGATLAGSSLKYAGVSGISTAGLYYRSLRTYTSGIPSGTWRCMGRSVYTTEGYDPVEVFFGATLWLRIS